MGLLPDGAAGTGYSRVFQTRLKKPLIAYERRQKTGLRTDHELYHERSVRLSPDYMNMKDIKILRDLAQQYTALAREEQNKTIPTWYRELNALKTVRPPITIFELPWLEFSGFAEMQCLCQDKINRAIEYAIRQTLFQFRWFRADHALHPYVRCPFVLRNTGIGLTKQEELIHATTGSEVDSHKYNDVLKDEDDLAKIKMPDIEIDKQATNRYYERYCEAFDGLMPVRKTGVAVCFAPWDRIPELHGVENTLLDLYDRPAFMHAIIEKLTQINEATMLQYEKLNILDSDPYYFCCAPACSYELPVKDNEKEQVYLKDVWCRTMAQIFGAVSPAMHDAFELQYQKRLFDRCGLVFYGCCEPLHNKIDLLRQIPNLRRISISPWADPDIAGEKMGDAYIMASRPNPAFVAGPQFDPEPVKKEIHHIIKAARRNRTPLEFCLKDISTVHCRPDILSQWISTVDEVIDAYEWQ